jgi:hypothetical protein
MSAQLVAGKAIGMACIVRCVVQSLTVRQPGTPYEECAEKKRENARLYARRCCRCRGFCDCTCSHVNLREGHRGNIPKCAGTIALTGGRSPGSRVDGHVPPSRFPSGWPGLRRSVELPCRSTVAGSAAIRAPGAGPPFAFPFDPEGLWPSGTVGIFY